MSWGCKTLKTMTKCMGPTFIGVSKIEHLLTFYACHGWICINKHFEVTLIFACNLVQFYLHALYIEVIIVPKMRSSIDRHLYFVLQISDPRQNTIPTMQPRGFFANFVCIGGKMQMEIIHWWPRSAQLGLILINPVKFHENPTNFYMITNSDKYIHIYINCILLWRVIACYSHIYSCNRL